MYKITVENSEEKCSKRLEKSMQVLMQEIKGLENRETVLREVEATLVINFGEKGRITQLWSGDLSTWNMLLEVLKFCQKTLKEE